MTSEEKMKQVAEIDFYTSLSRLVISAIKGDETKIEAFVTDRHLIFDYVQQVRNEMIDKVRVALEGQIAICRKEKDGFIENFLWFVEIEDVLTKLSGAK